MSVALRVDSVNVLQKLEGIDDGNIPPQLRALSEYDTDVADVFFALLPRNQAVDNTFAGVRGKDSAHYLNAGGLSGAVGADVANHTAIRDSKGDILQSMYICILPVEQCFYRFAHAGISFGHAKCFFNVLKFDHFVPSVGAKNVVGSPLFLLKSTPQWMCRISLRIKTTRRKFFT